MAAAYPETMAMTVQFSDEDRAAIASAEDVIKRQDAKIAEIERKIVGGLGRIREKVDEVAASSDNFGERLAALECEAPMVTFGMVNALGDRMTALEKMLTGYVTDLNALADRHSSYMMKTRAMVERLDKLGFAWRTGQANDTLDLADRVAKLERGLSSLASGVESKTIEAEDQVERRGEVWRLIAPEIYEGLPRDITAPIGAIIQGLSERVKRLDACLADERHSRKTFDGDLQSRIDVLAGVVNDLRASVKVLGEDITAVGDRLGDHLDASEGPTCDRDLGDETSPPRPHIWRQTSGFDHDYLARAVEESVADLAAYLVKRIKQVARAADLDEVPF